MITSLLMGKKFEKPPFCKKPSFGGLFVVAIVIILKFVIGSIVISILNCPMTDCPITNCPITG